MTDTQGVSSGGLAGPTDVGVSSVTTDSAKRDIRYEVLDMNSQGMYMCQQQQLDEAEAILTQAYNVLENDNTVHDAQTLDQLRSTTLNNLGVVECHKGLHKQALNHLEVAQTLEHQWDVHSPSVSLNICAACNALGMYDRATSAALDTIEMLRQTAKAAVSGGAIASDDNNPSSFDGPASSSSENSVLWGAAWHNLGVAQLNIASGKDLSEYTNVLALFHNAMESTTALLGAQHPMTAAVHETYRSIRQHLREAGVFKQHRALLTAELPPIAGKPEAPEPEPGMTAHATAQKQSKDFHLTLRGKETGGKKVVERYSSEAFPPAIATGAGGTTPRRTPRGTLASPRSTVSDHNTTARSNGGSIQKKGQSPIRGIPLSGNLLAASSLYRNPHPLLLHPRLRPVEYVPKAPSAADGSGRGGAREPLPIGGKPQQGSSSPPKHREQLSEEMWVEAVNRHQTTSSPRRQTNQQGSKPARPVYSQQLYALDSISSDQHRVTQPVQSAQSVGAAEQPNKPASTTAAGLQQGEVA